MSTVVMKTGKASAWPVVLFSATLFLSAFLLSSSLGAFAMNTSWQLLPVQSNTSLWSDEFSNLLGVFRWR